MGSNKHTDDIVGNTFSKDERLYHKKIIEELFKNGSSHFLYPFLLKYLPAKSSEQEYHQVLISVPKKYFRKAVARNLIKRKIREVYRTNKQLIYPSEIKYSIAIIYTGKEILPYKTLKNKLIKVLKRLPIKE
ncbi:MAG: ribonuclease P protein component [Bacteroidota bacterium]